MLERCVSSVIATTGEDVEIVVVDDASPEPLELHGLREISVVRTPSNLGFSAACNFGASRSTGDHLLFLNSDTEVHGAWLNDMLALMVPDVAIVGARLLYRDGSVQHAGIIFSQEDGSPRHVYRGFPPDHPAVARHRDFQAVTGACLLIQRADFLSDGFDEGYRNGFEDIDLCMRIQSTGKRVVYCGSTHITHLESVSIRTDKDADRAAHEANLLRFNERWNDRIHRDELAIYAADGLLRVEAADVYPLAVHVAPELGAVVDSTIAHRFGDLLNTRSRQVFDLEKEIGALAAELLDMKALDERP
jgi:GT2 family glycosyltransferase